MEKSHIRVLLCYKNFSNDCNISHIGLGVTAMYTAKTLNHAGYSAQAMAIKGDQELSEILNGSGGSHPHPVTHVVIMAQFITTNCLAALARKFYKVKFALNCHSNIGFLQAEPRAITLLREAIDLETGTPNFFAGGNNKRFVQSMELMFGRPMQFLPNLYFLHGQEPIHRPIWNGGTLRIGAFGSHRIYKNFSTAVAAAMILSHELKVQTELWVNDGRHDGFGNVVFRTAMAWTTGMPNIKLEKLHWTTWPEFKRFVGTMNLLLQPSYTETFNNVTADGVCEGTPSVVSDVIDWCPPSWIASTDDAMQVAQVGRRLLYDHNAARDGYRHLSQYVKDGLPYWEKFFQRP